MLFQAPCWKSQQQFEVEKLLHEAVGVCLYSENKNSRLGRESASFNFQKSGFDDDDQSLKVTLDTRAFRAKQGV